MRLTRNKLIVLVLLWLWVLRPVATVPFRFGSTPSLDLLWWQISGAWFGLQFLPTACATVGIVTGRWLHGSISLGVAWLCVAAWHGGYSGSAPDNQFAAGVLTLLTLPWTAVAAVVGVLIGRAFLSADATASAAPAAPPSTQSLGSQRSWLRLAVPLAGPVITAAIGSRVLFAFAGEPDYLLMLGLIVVVVTVSVIACSPSMVLMTGRLWGGLVVVVVGLACIVALGAQTQFFSKSLVGERVDLVPLGMRILPAIAVVCVLAAVAAGSVAKSRKAMHDYAAQTLAIHAALKEEALEQVDALAPVPQTTVSETERDAGAGNAAAGPTSGERIAVRCPSCGADNAAFRRACILCGRQLPG